MPHHGDPLIGQTLWLGLDHVQLHPLAFDQGELADQDVDPVHNLIEQVSLGLGQPWHAVMDIESLSVFTEPNRHFYREMQSFSEDI